MQYRELVFKITSFLELASSRERNLRLKLLESKLKPKEKKLVEQESFYMSGMVDAYERMLTVLGEYNKLSKALYTREDFKSIRKEKVI